MDERLAHYSLFETSIMEQTCNVVVTSMVKQFGCYDYLLEFGWLKKIAGENDVILSRFFIHNYFYNITTNRQFFKCDIKLISTCRMKLDLVGRPKQKVHLHQRLYCSVRAYQLSHGVSSSLVGYPQYSSASCI